MKREKQERGKGKSLQPSLSLMFSCPYLVACIGTIFLLSVGGPFSNHVFSYFEAPRQVSITDLLTNSQDYHQQLVTIRGLITQPELHLDETELYLDFVFRLAQGKHSMVVYGRHDRTRSAPSIINNHTVEVIGIFWKKQERKGSLIFNTIEAISVTPYPSPIPGKT